MVSPILTLPRRQQEFSRSRGQNRYRNQELRQRIFISALADIEPMRQVHRLDRPIITTGMHTAPMRAKIPVSITSALAIRTTSKAKSSFPFIACLTRTTDPCGPLCPVAYAVIRISVIFSLLPQARKARRVPNGSYYKHESSMLVCSYRSTTEEFRMPRITPLLVRQASRGSRQFLALYLSQLEKGHSLRKSRPRPRRQRAGPSFFFSTAGNSPRSTPVACSNSSEAISEHRHAASLVSLHLQKIVPS